MIEKFYKKNNKKLLKSLIIFIVFLINFIILYLINLSKENTNYTDNIKLNKNDETKILEEYINGNEFEETNTVNNNYEEIYTYLIAEYKTKFNEQNINRSTNIKISSDKINNTIVLPGEIFSYNKVVGNRTVEAGFKSASVYQDGKVVNGIGGGICQVSTTLYNAVMYANLTIIERKSHLFLPTYISVGRDATVADEYIDFKFINTRKYPIKIISSINNGILDIKIYGKKQENELDIEIESTKIETIPYKVIYEQDENVNRGEKEIIQKRKKWI